MTTREIPHAGLLKIRTWQRDQSAAVVQATQRQIEQMIDQIQKLSDTIAQWSQERRKLQSGLVKLQLWRDNEAYRSELIDQKNRLVQELGKLQKRQQAEREVLLEHETELKQVQKMIEHAELAIAAQRIAAEQSQLDEWAGNQARISRTTRP